MTSVGNTVSPGPLTTRQPGNTCPDLIPSPAPLWTSYVLNPRGSLKIQEPVGFAPLVQPASWVESSEANGRAWTDGADTRSPTFSPSRDISKSRPLTALP